MRNNTLKLFFCMVCILLTLTSCSEKKNKLLDFNGEVAPPTDVIFETEYREYSTDTETIAYVITNVTDGEIPIDMYTFDLQYKTADGWKSVCFKTEVYFPYPALILKPNESYRHELVLDEYYYLPLEAGEYRIVKESDVTNVFSVR